MCVGGESISTLDRILRSQRLPRWQVAYLTAVFIINFLARSNRAPWAFLRAVIQSYRGVVPADQKRTFHNFARSPVYLLTPVSVQNEIPSGCPRYLAMHGILLRIWKFSGSEGVGGCDDALITLWLSEVCRKLVRTLSSLQPGSNCTPCRCFPHFISMRAVKPAPSTFCV